MLDDPTNEQFPRHERKSCSDEHPVNAEPSGDYCGRCNAIFFDNAERAMQELTAERAWGKDVEELLRRLAEDGWVADALDADGISEVFKRINALKREARGVLASRPKGDPMNVYL